MRSEKETAKEMVNRSSNGMRGAGAGAQSETGTTNFHTQSGRKSPFRYPVAHHV